MPATRTDPRHDVLTLQTARLDRLASIHLPQQAHAAARHEINKLAASQIDQLDQLDGLAGMTEQQIEADRQRWLTGQDR